MKLVGALIHAAALLLPPESRNRFAAEWSAEAAELEHVAGRSAAVRFALGLFGAATKMTKAMRAQSASAYVELSVASLSALLPTFVFAGWAISTRMWPMLAIQVVIALGIMLVSAGLWSADGRLLDSIGSRIGLVLVLGASVASTLMLGSGEFDLLAEQRMSVTLPNTAILAGLALLVASNYARRWRGRVQLASLAVMAPGALVLLFAAMVNATAASGSRWAVESVFAIPAIVLLWACYSIGGRPGVFDEQLAADR